MALADLLSASTLQALQTVKAQAPKSANRPETFPTDLIGYITDFASDYGVKYSNKLWDMMGQDYAKSKDIIICIDGKEITYLSVRKHAIFAKHIGNLLKRGVHLLNVHGKFATEITWSNWSAWYNRCMLWETPVDSCVLDYQPSRYEMRQYRINSKREKMFSDCATPVGSRKKGRCRISFEEANNQRVKLQNVDFECKVVRGMNKILESI